MKTYVINLLVFIWLSGYLTGCVSYGEWSRSPSPYTWCAPGKRFVQESRRMYSAYAEGGEHRYVGCNGKEYRGEEPWTSIEKGLVQSQFTTNWSKAYDGRIKNTLDFYLVSFNPNIVIACAPNGRAREFPSLDSKVFERPLIIGTELSCQNPESWMTVPDGTINTVKVVSDTERMLEYKGTVITLKRNGSTWFAFREKR